MSLTEIILLALGLSMDCFAVAVSFGISRSLKWNAILKMAFFFALFQGIMPLIGWEIGDLIEDFLRSVNHWIAFGILTFIGLKMIIQSFRPGGEERKAGQPGFSMLLSLSLPTSIDALITGISFGFIRVRIILAVIIIAAMTFIVTILGAKIGERSTFIPARRAEFIGGLVLIAIGVKIVLEHLSIF